VAWVAARSAGEGQTLTPPSGDGQIAAVAAVHDLILVTDDLRDFEHCSRLRVELLHLTAPLSGKRR
jgi:predicted nucleic acid-binding protein